MSFARCRNTVNIREKVRRSLVFFLMWREICQLIKCVRSLLLRSSRLADREMQSDFM